MATTLKPSPITRNTKRLAALVLFLVLAGLAYLFFPRFELPSGIDVRPELIVGAFLLTAAGTLGNVSAEYLILRAGHSSKSSFLSLMSVAGVSNLAGHLSLFVTAPVRLLLYTRLLSVPAAAATAMLGFQTIIGTFMPAAIAIVFLAYRFPQIVLASLVVTAISSVFIAMILVVRSRLPTLRMPTILRRLRLEPVARVLAGAIETTRSFGPRIVLYSGALYVLIFVAAGLRSLLVLEMFDASAPLLYLIGIQAAAVTAGRLSLIPLGLGVREATMTSLLIELDIDASVAVSVALFDRGLSTAWRFLWGSAAAQVIGVRRILDLQST